MPIYAYVCTVCGYAFDIIRSIKDTSHIDCPECYKPVERVISAPMISFRGDGWTGKHY